MSIATNRKARHEYHILEKYEAGIALKGSEVKSIREGNVSIKESYVRFFDSELYIIGMHIAEYENKGYDDVQSVRDRKLLLHKRELTKLKSKVDEGQIARGNRGFYSNYNHQYSNGSKLGQAAKEIGSMRYQSIYLGVIIKL